MRQRALLRGTPHIRRREVVSFCWYVCQRCATGGEWQDRAAWAAHALDAHGITAEQLGQARRAYYLHLDAERWSQTDQGYVLDGAPILFCTVRVPRAGYGRES